MFEGALAKFSQNKTIRTELLNTNKKDLAESSPDLKWATGLPLHHPSAFDKNLWVGSNQLGNCLMLVRDRLA